MISTSVVWPYAKNINGNKLFILIQHMNGPVDEFSNLILFCVCSLVYVMACYNVHMLELENVPKTDLS